MPRTPGLTIVLSRLAEGPPAAQAGTQIGRQRTPGTRPRSVAGEPCRGSRLVTVLEAVLDDD